MAKAKRVCSVDGCECRADVKGLCKRHYMARYNRDYWQANRVDIIAHRKLYGRSKQSQ